jgi:apolipoprotein N-acyltransferase
MVALAPLAGLAAMPLVSSASDASTATAAVIQGNVPRLGLDFNAQRRAVLDNHVARTEELAADVAAGRVTRPDFVIWPENSSDIDPFRNPDAAAVIDRAVRAIGVPVLVGAVESPSVGGPRNTVIRWEPGQGPTGSYVKRRLQPFGETMPLRSVMRLFSEDVDRVAQDFVPGREPGVLRMGPALVGVATCYEAAFDSVVRDSVRAGASVLAVPSNNATFGLTDMTYQQLAMSRVRAVEHGRAVLVAATSGVSAVIRPDGTVTDRTRQFTPDALVAEIPLRTTLTLATRLGTIPEMIMVLGALTGLSAALLGRVRRPTRRGSVSGGARRAARADRQETRPSRGHVP